MTAISREDVIRMAREVGLPDVIAAHPGVKQLIEKAASTERERRQQVELMAECMDMVRQDLIRFGVIESSVPPMMVPEAIVVAMRNAVRSEREACAKVAEGFPANRDWVPGSLWGNIRAEVAKAIRARSTP